MPQSTLYDCGCSYSQDGSVVYSITFCIRHYERITGPSLIHQLLERQQSVAMAGKTTAPRVLTHTSRATSSWSSIRDATGVMAGVPADANEGDPP
jgi:hypothetical protein